MVMLNHDEYADGADGDRHRRMSPHSYCARSSLSSTYIAMAWAMGGSMALEAVGAAGIIVAGNTTMNITSLPVPTLEAIQQCGESACKFGLLHDFGVKFTTDRKPFLKS